MTQDEQDDLMLFLQWLVEAALDQEVGLEVIDYIPPNRVLH